MATIDFTSYYEELADDLYSLVKSHFRKYRNAATKDVGEYLNVSKGMLQDYVLLAQQGRLSEKDRRFLEAALEENAKMYALKESRRSLTTLKNFTKAVVVATVELLLVSFVKSKIV